MTQSAPDHKELIRNLLIDTAKAGRTMTYSQAASQVGLDIRRAADSNQLTSVLRAIAEDEHKQDRPLLSVICVMAGVKRPGQGFFDTARNLGVMKTGQDNREFFEEESARVHAHWKG